MSADLLPLRPYQRACVDKVRAAWAGGMSRPAAVLPTGAGKTVIFAHLAAEVHAESGQKSFVLVHTDELVEQALAQLRRNAPGLRVGRVQGPYDELDADLVVGTVQTLRSGTGERLARAVRRGPWRVICDEAHHATARSYRTAIDALSGQSAAGGAGHAVGFTATMSRGDGAALGDVWDEVVYRRSILDMIRDGWLLPVRGKRIKIAGLDLRGVRQSGGDYQAGALDDVLHASLAPDIVAGRYRELAGDRTGITFAPTVDSAYEFHEAYKREGIEVDTVHGGLPKPERRAILRALDRGDIQMVSNCMVLTEGFDCTRLSCAVIARPTRSAGLYMQMVGRILRPHPGQADALVIDVVGVAGRHKLASLVDLAGDPSLCRPGTDDQENLADLLLDAEGLEFVDEREAAGASAFPAQYEEGETEVVDVDLFSRSHAAWLRTAGGAWFLPGRVTVFVAADGGTGTYAVAATDGRAGRVTHRGVDLSAAMAWGEELAGALGGEGAERLLSRGARWRKSGTMSTRAQVRKATELGIAFGEMMTKAELADKISITLGSQIVDPIVGRWGVA